MRMNIPICLASFAYLTKFTPFLLLSRQVWENGEKKKHCIDPGAIKAKVNFAYLQQEIYYWYLLHHFQRGNFKTSFGMRWSSVFLNCFLLMRELLYVSFRMGNDISLTLGNSVLDCFTSQFLNAYCHSIS